MTRTSKGVGLVREEQRTTAGGVLVLELVARDVERPEQPGGPRGGASGRRR